MGHHSPRQAHRWPVAQVKDFVPLAGLNDLVFTGWDIFEDDMYAAAGKAGVLDRSLLEQVKPFLSSIKPRKAVFDKNYVKKLDGPNVKKGKNKMELVEQLRDDIRDFKKSVEGRAPGHDLVRLDRELHRGRPGASDGEVVREGAARQRREHRAFDDLRLRGDAGGCSVRQRRSEPDGRHSGHPANCRSRTKRPSAARTTRPGRR